MLRRGDYLLPKGAGLCSAFRMMCEGVFNVDRSGKDGSEIDVFESAYYSNAKFRDTVSSAIHYDGYSDAHKSTNVHQTHDFSVETGGENGTPADSRAGASV